MATHKAFTTAIFLFVVGTAALQAKESQDNVVTIDVTNVQLPAKLPGLCGINGVVETVWKGKAFRSGEPLSLQVPCGTQPRLIFGPSPLPLVTQRTAQPIDTEVLQRSKLGFAHLSDDGALIWEPTSRSFGTWGAAFGYRVLDGVTLPVGPQHSSS